MRKNISQISIFVVISVFCAYFLLSNLRSFEEEGSTVKVHVTLYVGGELLRDGGTVIVSSVALPEQDFLALEGENLAARDPNNEKRAALSKQDVLFGARVSGRANFVEMYYPEGATFGFNFVVDPVEGVNKTLLTERILIGSTRWPDPQNKNKWIDADTSTIYVDGPKSSKSMSRLIRAYDTKIQSLELETEKYMGVTVSVPTFDQLKQGTFGEFR